LRDGWRHSKCRAGEQYGGESFPHGSFHNISLGAQRLAWFLETQRTETAYFPMRAEKTADD